MGIGVGVGIGMGVGVDVGVGVLSYEVNITDHGTIPMACPCS